MPEARAGLTRATPAPRTRPSRSASRWCYG